MPSEDSETRTDRDDSADATVQSAENTHTAAVYCPDCGWFRQYEREGMCFDGSMTDAEFMADNDARLHMSRREFSGDDCNTMVITDSGTKRWESEVGRFVR
jgi:adenine-specific DNA methylase